MTEAFMTDIIAGTLGAGHSWKRLPRSLCAEHDLYVVAKGTSTDLANLAPQAPPIGYVEGVELLADGTLQIGGWAGDATGQSTVALELLLDELSYPAQIVRLARPDVVGVTKVPGLLNSGFHLRADGLDSVSDLGKEVALEVIDQKGIRVRLGHCQLLDGMRQHDLNH